jgi:hypothetical protein
LEKKKYKIVRFGHGWFGGGVQDTDICPTIDACVNFQHILIWEETEIEKGNKLQNIRHNDRWEMG